MTDLLFARGQMAVSLAFHIVFAAVGVAMPVLMVMADIGWLRTRDQAYLELARRWAKGTAILFAVGAVSGTVLSFELGLLFPEFMRHAGAVIGMPFSLEGFAFFTEAIFLGLYLYGRDRLPPALHVASGVMVALAGLASAAFVLIANAWMNAPTGFRVENGQVVDVDPIAAMQTPFASHEILHMVAAIYMSVGFGVAAIHAAALLRRRESAFHRKALALALWLAIPFALVQPLIGHWAGQQVARWQPMKLAAIEQLERTQARAPLVIGPIEIEGGLSFFATGDADAVVKGLEEVPPEDRPPAIVRPAFLLMVAIGFWFVGLSAWALGMGIRRRPWAEGRAFLWSLVASGALGFVAIEAGWVVTEVGRQPWVIYDFLRTADAVTPMPGLVVPFTVFCLVYLALGAAVAVILVRHVRATLEEVR